ncbi:hypothetical protein H072_184 [Dactylellina haptotyla CBS 200.50]|uniref:BTB domain-containing protein n=1 Tax=Dactylellina haptotyla (strain CBS 200.50) TaxID=1284197 RepID=S8ASC8_DACHA|nr:hypothetical protein H072_184 [Dactylellina haptotyla CBS 200.50]
MPTPQSYKRSVAESIDDGLIRISPSKRPNITAEGVSDCSTDKDQGEFLLRQLGDPEYSDVTVIVGPGKKVYKLHRIIICAKSSFFKACLRHQFLEEQMREIKLPEIDSRSFDIIVDWMYRGSLSTDWIDRKEPSRTKFKQLLQAVDFMGLVNMYLDTNEQVYKLHRVIICSQSQFFKTCLRDGFMEGASREIRLPEIKAGAFEVVVGRMYGEKIPLSWDNSVSDDGLEKLTDIFEAANFLLLEFIQREILVGLTEMFQECKELPAEYNFPGLMALLKALAARLPESLEPEFLDLTYSCLVFYPWRKRISVATVKQFPDALRVAWIVARERLLSLSCRSCANLINKSGTQYCDTCLS